MIFLEPIFLSGEWFCNYPYFKEYISVLKNGYMCLGLMLFRQQRETISFWPVIQIQHANSLFLSTLYVKGHIVIYCTKGLCCYAKLRWIFYFNTQEGRCFKSGKLQWALHYFYMKQIQLKYVNWARHLHIWKPSINHVFLSTMLVTKTLLIIQQFVYQKTNPSLLLWVHDLQSLCWDDTLNFTSFRSPSNSSQWQLWTTSI